MAKYISNRNGGKTDEQGHYRFHVNAWDGNILNDGLKVKQNSPLGMSVLIEPGDVKIDYSTYGYTGWNDADEAVTIATADGSNPRIDRIVAYVDRVMTPNPSNSNNPGMLKFMSVAGTPAGSPSPVSDSTVNTAVSSNPWCELAQVQVNSGVSTITNGSITDKRTFATPKIADGAVTPEKLQSGTGSSWAWQSWTPTWTNVTIGNATVNAKYIQIGKTVHCTILMTAGSTTSFGASVFRITLPITAESRYAATATRAPNIGVAYYEDAGIAGYQGIIQGVSTTVVQFVVANVTGTYPGNTAVTSTIPFTWGNGDYIGGSFTYEAA